MIIEYFTHMSQEDLDKFIDAYYEALESNDTTFNFSGYNVSTTFANTILKYNDINVKEE
tara:strand:- start:972 stop:1148 length:177 start_codon:yes stop_codon:yes gene_type:complete